MSEEKTFNSLKERIAFIQRDVDLLAQNKGDHLLMTLYLDHLTPI